jgi:hypothetical protein
MQPRIKADGSAFCVVFQPVTKLYLGPIDRGEHICRLFAHLQAITAIDKETRLIRQDSTKARRSRKACQPRQTFVTGRNVFALMRICARDKESIQPYGRHLDA